MRYSTVLITLFVFSACGPLHKTQVTMSHSYFEAISSFPVYYRELNLLVAELELEARNLESALQSEDSVRISSLIHSINTYEESIKLPDSIINQAKFIDTYVQDYYLLLPDGYSLYGALKGTTESIGGIFGLGGVVKSILPNKINGLSSNRSRKVRRYVLRSEQQLLSSLNDLREFLKNVYIQELEDIEKRTKKDFNELLHTINGQTSALEHYTVHNRMLTLYFRRLFLTKAMIKALIKSIDNFIEVEMQIVKSFEERQKVELEKTNINELIHDVQRLNIIFEDLQQHYKK